MRKKILEKRLARLKSIVDELKARAQASEDVNEVRAINEQLTYLTEDIAEVREEIEAIEEETRDAQPEIPANAQLVNAHVVQSTEMRDAKNDDMEYRKAFMAYVQTGKAIPAELRNGEAISTSNAGAPIPMTVMNEVINTVRKRYGNLYAKARKTAVKGGVEIPIGALSATFKWISEDTVSPRQKAGNVGKVTFAYHTAEIRIAQTFLSSILSIDAFEAKIAELIAIAYLQAMDEGIVKGTGKGQMLGILNDPRVTNEVSMSEADINDWTKWRKNFFAKLPLGYRSGEFIFPVSTVDAYLETMADNNNNPIFRQATGLEVNDGDAQNPSGRFFGRDISLVEEDILPDFATASAGDVIGIYWQPEEYVINENFGFTMRRYFDEETNEWIDKAIVVVDGKPVNTTGFYLIKKKAS